MTFLELLGIMLSSAGVFASILGAFLTYAARQNGRATRELIRTMKAETVAILQEILQEMDKRADERHRELDQRAVEMDKRADDRHSEVLQVITALKAG